MTEPLRCGEERIALRPIDRRDASLIVRWRNNPRVRGNFIYREPFTEETHRRWFEERIEGTRDVVQWIVLERRPEEPAGRPIGSVYLRDIDRSAGTAEYGVFLGEDDAVGRGYAGEILDLVCGAAKRELGLRRLILRVYCDNLPALRSYERGGFRATERLGAVRATDGEEKDMFLMEREL